MFSKFHLKKVVFNKLPNIGTFSRRYFSTHSKVAQETAPAGENLSARFHSIYLKELEKLEKSS